MKYFYRLLSVITVSVLSILVEAVHAGPVFDAIKQHGSLRCGVSDGLPGFSQLNEQGHYHGLDVDICRAVAAAVFGDADRIEYIPLTARQRFTALRQGEVDMLSRNTTWTSSRDTALGLNFTGIAYYDGQGFLVNRKQGIKDVRDLDGTTLCMQEGTTTELNVEDYFDTNRISYTPLTFARAEDSAVALAAGRCAALTGDQSHLYALRLTFSQPDDYVVLPEIISKEPLGPVVRHGDDEWFDVVKWTLFAMINAEELGVNSANVDIQKKSLNPRTQRLLGVKGRTGQNLGLSDDWAFQIIKQVGNYGEIFSRNVGEKSELKIERGLNALWTRGGLHYAPPIR